MNIVTERRLINLNSEDASIYNNGSYLSDVIFDFRGLLKDERNMFYVEGGILNAQLPVSFYQVAYYNNTLYYTVNTFPFNLTIPVGNYNFATFATALESAFLLNGHTVDVTIAETTGKLSLQITGGGTSLSILGASSGTTISKVLGFDPTQDTVAATTVIAPFLLNLLGAKKLKIFSETFSNNSFDSTSATTGNLIGTISVDAPSYGLIIYNNTQDTYGKLRQRRIDSIDIQIKDEYGNLINFNNTDWSITLAILIYRNMDTKMSDLNDVVSALNIGFQTLDNDLAQILPQPSENPPIEDNPPTEEIPMEQVPQEDGQANLDETTDLDLLLYENPTMF